VVSTGSLASHCFMIGQVGLDTVRVIVVWQLVFVSCPVLPGFQGGYTVTAEENDSEQRLR
jgi:hypothetical protein